MNIHVFSAYFSAPDSSGHYLRSLRLFGTIFRLSAWNFCFVTLIIERHEIVDLHSVTLLFQKNSHFWHFPHFFDKSTLPFPPPPWCENHARIVYLALLLAKSDSRRILRDNGCFPSTHVTQKYLRFLAVPTSAALLPFTSSLELHVLPLSSMAMLNITNSPIPSMRDNLCSRVCVLCSLWQYDLSLCRLFLFYWNAFFCIVIREGTWKVCFQENTGQDTPAETYV